jgi:hypothetical protein
MYDQPSTIHKANDFFNSGIGIAGVMAMDWYADKHTDELMDQYRKSAPGKGNRQFQNNFNKLHIQKSNRFLGGARDGTRNIIRKIPYASKVFRTGEEVANTRANKVLLRDMLDDPNKMGIDKVGGFGNSKKSLMKKFQNIRTFKNITIGAAGLFAASAGISMAKGTINAFISRGNHAGDRTYGMATASGFMDSSMAYTTRQAAVRAIQNSQGSVRRALGNEASFIGSNM